MGTPIPANLQSSRLPSFLVAAAGVTRFHIVLIAACGTLTFTWFLTGRESVALALVAAFDWFLVNLLNRVVDQPEDRINRVVGAEAAAARARPLVVGGLAALAASFALHLAWLPALALPRAAYHLLGAAYNWRLLPLGRGGARVRLKEVYAVKNCASAAGFLLTLFAYPLVAFPADRRVDAAAAAVMAVFFFLFEISYEIIYDLRDVPGDRAAGVPTWPAVHGEAAAGRIVLALLAAAGGLLVAAFFARAVPWHGAIMAAAPAFQAALFLRWSRRGPITGAHCVLVTLLGAALLLLYNAWRWAGLPLDLL